MTISQLDSTLNNHSNSNNIQTSIPPQTQNTSNPQSNNNQTTKTNSNNLASSSSYFFKETSYVLIKRLFGCLDNINKIKDPYVHKRIIEFIYNKWERLNRFKDDYKITDLSQTILPLSYFSPWMFECIYQLSSTYSSGKLIAYKTLCCMCIRSAILMQQQQLIQINKDENGTSGFLFDEFEFLSDEFMDLFYITLHNGLKSNDKQILNCIIQNCGTRFWHCMLPSSTLLIKDFIDACLLCVDSSVKLEAASILGCLISFPDFYGNLKVLTNSDQIASKNIKNDNEEENETNNCELTCELFGRERMKNLLVNALTSFNDELSATASRSIVLCALTCFIFDEIYNHKWDVQRANDSQRLNDAIKRIFKDLDLKDVNG